MRPFLLSLLLLLMFSAGSSQTTSPGKGSSPAATWKKIDQLLARDQTATAARLLEPLYQRARQQQTTPEYLRALLYKLRLLGEREEEASEKAIALVEADLKTARFPARPVLHSLLAQLYTQYYAEHRYQLYDRTTTAPAGDASAPTADLSTWDATRLGSAIVSQYRASLAEEPGRQQQLQLSALGYAVWRRDAEGLARRPTLFDLLAHRAVAGLRNEEYYLTQPAQQFALRDSALFGPAAGFARLRLAAPAADSLSGQLHALQVLQQLTAFRLQQAGNPTALADVELLRLEFVRQYTTLPNADARYQAALARAAVAFQNLPVAAEFLAAQAQSLAAAQPARAREVALAAEKRYPRSRGARQARTLRQQLEAPELHFTTEDVVLPAQPWLLKLHVRNAPVLHAAAYRISTVQQLREQQRPAMQEAPVAKRYARVLAAQPAATWALPVPGPADYTLRTVQHAGPALPVGRYLIVLSTMAGKAAQPRPGATTAYAELSVSELSYLQRSSADGGGAELLVLHRQSGAPLPGVQVLPLVQYFNQGRNEQLTRRGATQTTTAAGQVQVPLGLTTGENTRLTAVLLTRGSDSLLTTSATYYSPRRQPEVEQPQRRTFLYTDRAIYRPGQTLYFKGILTETSAGKSQLLTRQPVSVRVLDVNGQTLQTLPFTSSEFGSFHGSVVLPTGLLNGQMSLQTDNGSISFGVEDYKRPTFQVTLAPVAGTPVLGQQVVVHGTATAYAGQPVDGATVQYRVVRRTFWPLLFGRGPAGYPPGGRAEVEVLSGTAQTDSAGGFALTFMAQGEDKGSQPRGPWAPGYVFAVTADVTNAAGETRTGEQRLSLGPVALTLRLELPDLLNREQLPALRLLSTSSTNEARPARGQVRLYRLTPPGPVLRPRLWEQPEREALSREEFKRRFPLDAYGAEDQDSTWARTLVLTQEFDTEKSPVLSGVAAQLPQQPPGRYVLEATAPTPAGGPPARTAQAFTLYSATATTLPIPTPDWFVSLQDSAAPGQVARFLVGSAQPGARVLLQAEAKGKTLRQEWLTLAPNEQRLVEVPVAAALEGSQLHVHLTQVRDNRLYSHSATVQVATPPAPLTLSIATFRDKLQPGQRETWRLTIRQADGKPAAAELLATLYDKSLDAFQAHNLEGLQFWPAHYPAGLAWQGRFDTAESTELFGPAAYPEENPILYPHLAWWGFSLGDEESSNDYLLLPNKISTRFPPPVVKQDAEVAPARALPGKVAGVQVRLRGMRSNAAPLAEMGTGAMMSDAAAAPPAEESGSAGPNLTAVPTRQDFRETAFWMPALRTNAEGETVLEFLLPEAVTRWQLLALAHDQQLHSGLLRRELVTQKQLQVTLNAPRFFREGDQLRLSAQLSNLTAEPLQGTAQLFLLDARTQQPLASQLVRSPAQLSFELPASQSRALSWELTIPETAVGQVPLEALTYRVVASAELAVAGSRLSGEKKRAQRQQRRQHKPATGSSPMVTVQDGEENTLPVLPNQVLMTESLPLSLVGPATREFELKSLTSTTSPTRRNYSLTLEMSPNPAWYAVQALPYLMEYPHESAEQVFSRLYANLLAAKILQSTPPLKATLAEWKRAAAAGDHAALTSKLEQQPALKALLLQETPWVREAQSETERMRRLAELFDEPRLQAETTRALAQLARLQHPNGAFPWFEQMPDDRYITQLIVAGFGKLQRLGALGAATSPQAQEVLRRALAYLDARLAADYARLRQQPGLNLKQQRPSDVQVQALYARSFWPAEPIAKTAQPALAFYQQQAAAYWPEQTRYLQAQLALALHRQQTQPATVQAIFTALRENALHSPELGMYWKEVRGGYYWRQAPTETQATLIEAFDEVQHDQRAVDEMKLWLLQQKHVQNWESTRATADACYALLLRGTNWLVPAHPLQVRVGGNLVFPSGQQAGTGYFSTTFPAAEISSAQGKVTVQKPDAGVAWGALYWQYFEQPEKLQAAAAGLQLARQFYREERTATGPVLQPLTTAAPLRVGDVLVVRLVLRADQDLEYVHLKDQRAAGLEPIGQTSGYRYQGGLGYYESSRDAATNFFIGSLPKGTHTFEYRLRAAQSGNFSGGLSQLQCLYAPEFAAHSTGSRLRILPPQ
ncbi:hypothetical protein K3G63_11270 [Hymenobacter sp. HSC-4F20]|uniref:alpha-2-macroglobulin family protein n=1 Tax=Hymenobacter sp. HSC-4F20 TaxID=2864135 RepID=UPI001C737414|nr:MG2 domain-containing protein [Hymenobacter sp. HSC-4F20]MBX0291024.1 hypothetical protein [Hymenobacter sp. HSC-4F20]